MGWFKKSTKESDDDGAVIYVTAHPAAANTKRVMVMSKDKPRPSSVNAGSNGRR